MAQGDMVAAGEFDKIAKLTNEAVTKMLGFELKHVGINENDEASASSDADKFGIFGFDKKDGNSSVFASTGIEIMKTMYLGTNGHIAVRTNSIPLAIAALEKKGYSILPETAKSKNGRMIAVYLAGEFGGFAIHLVNK